MFRWYVINTYSGHEKKVKANLETRVQNLDVGDYIFQVEVPTEEVTEAEFDLVMNVSKNNFRPPPKVESSVVRVVPRDPPPPVEFGEFDGLGRIIFERRNKTVHANFMAKGVMEMLETNWKTWASVNNVVRHFYPVISSGLS